MKKKFEKKNLIIVTGGAGFVGSNLIKFLLQNYEYNILSIDDYSSGSVSNHFNNKKVKYLKGSTINIEKYLSSKKKKFTQFFTLESFPEFIKVFLNLMIVLCLIVV